MKPAPDFITNIQNVSRETICNFVIYGDLLEKWNPTINLVGKSTLDDFWRRHILDSIQIYKYIPNATGKILADFGSGAGFPGMVLAMMGLKQVHLIESDARKCVFLQTVARETKTPVEIHNKRIEDCAIKADIITARALAPLAELIDYAKDKINPNGVCLFLKGQDWKSEVKLAMQRHEFRLRDHPSETDPSARILEVHL